AKLGDYVLVHTGFAIGIVDEEEAQETLRLLRELAEFYDEETIAAEMVPTTVDERRG
ncbi:MAG: HypC/HybG/HupF family hydrogenase formation chaperone, partial [Planctomycetes bacterium]|nr:HypC/HybG/HupF family hydrogenase formation chaperone [Planctomycetota bacterium]